MTSPRFIESCRFAAIKHASQRRKAANRAVIPYVTHPIEASQILAEVGVSDEDILIAAVLHDILEDTDATEDDLRFKFGERVLSIVKEVTDDPELSREEQKKMQVINAPTKTYAAKLVKCADKTSNMRDLIRCPPKWKIDKFASYTQHARLVVTKLNTNNEIPPQLAALFWQASQDVLDWCEEQVVRSASDVLV